MEVEVLSELHRVSGAVITDEEPDFLDLFDETSDDPVSAEATYEFNLAQASTGSFSVSAEGWMDGAAFAASRYLFRPVEDGGVGISGSAFIGDPITRGDFSYRLMRVIDNEDLLVGEAPPCGFTEGYEECETIFSGGASVNGVQEGEVYQLDLVAASSQGFHPQEDPFEAPGVGLPGGTTSSSGAVSASLVAVPNPDALYLLLFGVLMIAAIRPAFGKAP